jgi:hypothetical protein
MGIGNDPYRRPELSGDVCGILHRYGVDASIYACDQN